jgi:hypothetical protein
MKSIVTFTEISSEALENKVDWLVNSSLTGPICSRALKQLTQLEILTAREKIGRLMHYERTPLLQKMEAAVAAPPDSEWLTSDSKRAALNDSILPWGKDRR